ncbi:MAG: peptidase S1 [Spirochaetia bacterium]
MLKKNLAYLMFIFVFIFPIASQNIQNTPTYGVHSLSAGFPEDPYSIEVQAGGGDYPRIQGIGYVGYIYADAPDILIEYEEGEHSLYFHVFCSVDSTLLIHTPQGEWLFNDDTYGHDPGIHIEEPVSGNYTVWIGTYRDSGVPRAVLRISENAF